VARNEERWLGQCLQSIREAVDEIIVVDTGSTDRTREIAAEYGAAVYEYPWPDSFAKARNYSVDQAQGDWVIWLDADEEIAPGDAAKLREVLEGDPDIIQLAGVQMVNYYGDSPPDRNRSHRMNQVRLFRRAAGFRFRNAIHEQLYLADRTPAQAEVLWLPVTVHHYGYLDETVDRRNKGARNMQLLQQEKATSTDPWVDYHIASEHYRMDDYEEAYRYVNQSIMQFLKQGDMPPSLLYKLKYSLLLTTRPDEATIAGIDLAIQLYPDYVDLYYFKGLLLFQLKRYPEAAAVFRQCMSLGEKNSGHLVSAGSGTFLAYYYLGRCRRELGDEAEARNAFAQALQLNPDLEEAREMMHELGG
jgi:glycosyltransferase involved in cell wall biosynthesis